MLKLLATISFEFLTQQKLSDKKDFQMQAKSYRIIKHYREVSVFLEF